MSFDAMDQGATTNQDELGFDLEPVTDPSSEQEGQSETTQTPAPTPTPKVEEKKPEGEKSGASTIPNAEAKKKRVEEKKEKITQEEWQTTQERLANLERENLAKDMELQRTKFEAKNPIVMSEKHSKRWEELCEMKKNPEHKYHKLDFSDLKLLLIDNEAKEETLEAEEEMAAPKPVPVPTFGTTVPKGKIPGNVDPETYSWLKSQGYSDAQIAESDSITLQ